MLNGIYIDLVSRKVVGILPKPPFYRLFDSLKRNPKAKALTLNPENLVQIEPDPFRVLHKETAPVDETPEWALVLVETEEGGTPPETRALHPPFPLDESGKAACPNVNRP
jgi:hypothetical protein